MADRDESNGTGWKELCVAASEEPDSQKLLSLVNQIIQAFDENEEERGPAAGIA